MDAMKINIWSKIIIRC